jgi:hypothetical protein
MQGALPPVGRLDRPETLMDLADPGACENQMDSAAAMGQTALAFPVMRRCGDRVAGKPLEGLGHVFDRGVLVLIGHRAGRMSHDGVTHPRINPGPNRTALERMPPAVVRLDPRMIDPEGPDPLRPAFTAGPR